MQFLAPAFLAGLVALAIPVIIHLINRERRELVAFPSLMFLRKISYRSVRRQRLRHLLLLALRCLALAIIVAAFARPFFARHFAFGSASSGAREVVVLVDRSYSMAYGARWRRATQAARQATRGLTGGDRATLVWFSNDAQPATPPTGDASRIDAALAGATPGDGGTNYAPALTLAQRVLTGSNLPRKELVLISDFQRRGWDHPEEISLPAGTRVTPVDVTVGEGDAPDLAVASVTTARDSATDRTGVTVAARVTNTGKAVARVPVILTLNGRQVQTKSVSVPAGGATQVTFARAAVPSGDSRGVVSIPHDALQKDDQFQFVISPEAGMSVLVLQPASPRPNQSLFLSRALAIGDRPSFSVTVKSVDALAPSDLPVAGGGAGPIARTLVVLNEVAPPAGAAGERLREFVQGGGGLLVVPGDTKQSDWSPAWRAVLPGELGPIVERTGDGGGTLGSIDYGNPVFELFNGPHNGDLSAARFFRYRSVRPVSQANVLARFDDGTPALLERRLGAANRQGTGRGDSTAQRTDSGAATGAEGGRIVLWTSTLDTYWSDLALQPVFLPFVHQLAKNAGAYTDTRTSYTVGEVLDLTRHHDLLAKAGQAGGGMRQGTAPANLEVVTPLGARLPLDAAGHGSRPSIALEEQGFYTLRAVGGAGSGTVVAANVDPAESDLSHMDPKELLSALAIGDGKTSADRVARDFGAGQAGSEARQEEERRQTLWWYLLAGAMLLLAAETVMSNRLSRPAA